MPYIRKLPSGLWQATVRMPNGRRITKTDPLKAVVKEWATEQEARFNRGDLRDPRAGEIEIGVWRDRVTAARSLEPSTLAKLDTMWRTHCEATWAEWPMAAVTRMEAQEWVKRLQKTRRARHKGRPVTKSTKDIPLIGAETIHAAVNTMSKLYALAMAETPPIITVNPFAGLDLPEITPRPVEYYEREEAELLYAAFDDVKWRTLAKLGMKVGLRPGEIYGLHAHRIEWPRLILHVTHVMTRFGLREYPKSKKSHRAVPIPPDVGEDMSTLMQGDGRDAFAGCTCPKVLPDGTRQPGSGPCPSLMFTAPGGGPIDDGNFRDRVWYPAVKAAGIRRFPPKIMRHTAASHLVQDGVPLYDVQDLLGHESPATTQRYAHLAPEAHDKIKASWQRHTTEDIPDSDASVTHDKRKAHFR